MTVQSLALFLDISYEVFLEWKKTREDLASVIQWAEGIIREQKFSGATAGLFNANIIIRDLGLRDVQSYDITVPGFFVAPPDSDAPDMPPVFGE